jgi:hypothetical protein
MMTGSRPSLCAIGKDDYIQELELAQRHPFLNNGTSPVLQLITREEADVEQRSLNKELLHWKDRAKQAEDLGMTDF